MIETWDFASIVFSSSLSRDTVPGNYSAFKLGRAEDIATYARMTNDRMVARMPEQPYREWLVTGPPLTAIPCAANLLAESIVALRNLDGGENFKYRPVRKSSDAKHFPTGHYAHLDRAERLNVLEAARRDDWAKDTAHLNASIIVIDDVRVTGAHEHVMRSFLEMSGVERVHWQYLLDLRLTPGSTAEVAEPRLNSVSIDDRGIAELVREDQFQPTTRFVWGLFATDFRQFADVVELMRARMATLILRLIQQEGITIEDERRHLLVRRAVCSS